MERLIFHHVRRRSVWTLALRSPQERRETERIHRGMMVVAVVVVYRAAVEGTAQPAIFVGHVEAGDEDGAGADYDEEVKDEAGAIEHDGWLPPADQGMDRSFDEGEEEA